jgi:hypothetical protein
VTARRPVAGRYQDWVDWLEAYGRGEDRPAHHLAPYTEDMGPDYQFRLVERILAAFQARLDRWSSLFSRDLRAVNTPTGYAGAMVSARQRLGPLHRLADSPLLPEAVRTGLSAALSTVVEQVQESLAETAHRDCRALVAVIRDHDLRHAAPTPMPAATPPRPPGRRVII